MKRILNILFVGLLIVAASCNKNEVTPEQALLNKLEGTWVLGNGVFVDNENITSQYSGFTITFNNDKDLKVYDIVNGGEAFPQATDTYTFTDETFTAIERKSDGVIIDVLLDGKVLNLNLSILPEAAAARTEGTYGEFKFNLKKQ